MTYPDYDLADSLDVGTAEQHKALGNLTRHRILGLLLDRARTATQLADALGVLKGSAAFHLGVLERAGLVRVVRTQKVRGVTEKYYGRTARRFELDRPEPRPEAAPLVLRTVAAELERVSVEGSPADMVTSARARLDPARAAEFRDRLATLIEEFQAASRQEQPAYSLAVAIFRSEPGEAPPDAAGRAAGGAHPDATGDQPARAHPDATGDQPARAHPDATGDEPARAHPDGTGEEPARAHPDATGDQPARADRDTAGHEPAGEAP